MDTPKPMSRSPIMGKGYAPPREGFTHASRGVILQRHGYAQAAAGRALVGSRGELRNYFVGTTTVWHPVSTSSSPPALTVPHVVVQRRICVGVVGLS